MSQVRVSDAIRLAIADSDEDEDEVVRITSILMNEKKLNQAGVLACVFVASGHNPFAVAAWNAVCCRRGVRRR